MLKETLKDTAQILQTILTQELDIPGASGPISLLSAAKQFASQDAVSSNLSHVIRVFLNYPDPLNALSTELEILAKELHEVLRR
jgi:hypothetical protein